MQVSSHSLQKRKSRTLASPPSRSQKPTPAPEAQDRFQSSSENNDSPSFLGLTLLGLTAITGFVAGRATVPQEQIVTETEAPCECREIDLQHQNPDDWKEDIGGAGDVTSGEAKAESGRKAGKSKSAPSAETDRRADYDYPDAWKEEIGGGHRSKQYEQDDDSGDSYNDSVDDWEGPDDWKAGL